MSDPVLVPYDEYKELIEIKNKYKKVERSARRWKKRAEELNRENYGLNQTILNLRMTLARFYGHPSRDNRR